MATKTTPGDDKPIPDAMKITDGQPTPMPPAEPSKGPLAAPKLAGSEPEQPIYVMATADGTFQYPNQVRAFHFAQGAVFIIPGKSFLRRWMKIVAGPNVQPPPRPPETTAANQPGFNNNLTPPGPLIPGT